MALQGKDLPDPETEWSLQHFQQYRPFRLPSLATASRIKLWTLSNWPSVWQVGDSMASASSFIQGGNRSRQKDTKTQVAAETFFRFFRPPQILSAACYRDRPMVEFLTLLHDQLSWPKNHGFPMPTWPVLDSFSRSYLQLSSELAHCSDLIARRMPKARHDCCTSCSLQHEEAMDLEHF